MASESHYMPWIAMVLDSDKGCRFCKSSQYDMLAWCPAFRLRLVRRAAKQILTKGLWDPIPNTLMLLGSRLQSLKII